MTQSRGRARPDWWLRFGNHTVKSGSTLQSLTALSVGEAEFYAVVKGDQVGLSLRSFYHGLRIPMKVEIQSDSSSANSLTDRLGAGQRNTLTRGTFGYNSEYKTEISVSRRCLPAAKNGADVETEPVSASVLQQHCKFAGLVFY